MNTLYIVATPIGNLEDITLRAIRILNEVDLIASEDTRTTRVLLNHFDIKTPTTSFHAFTGPSKVARLVERLNSGDVAIVSDAGTPGVSDPGFPLIRAAIDAGHTVVPIPGPSAVLAGLTASGIPMHAFTFLGFLPRKKGARRNALVAASALDHAFVFFESPHRLRPSLDDLAEVLSDRTVAIGRELTKKFEEILRGTPDELRKHFETTEPRGEFTVVVAGPGKSPVLE